MGRLVGLLLGLLPSEDRGRGSVCAEVVDFDMVPVYAGFASFGVLPRIFSAFLFSPLGGPLIPSRAVGLLRSSLGLPVVLAGHLTGG